ncbi:fibronectin type III domain-containing protein [Herbaspirillum sp. 1130]|uniref:fibronectin type III domain-containing protein n=1 Tax=Herbaspirillum sp. 1130 TaxID=2806562 RepID=UPI001AE8AD5B|nr:fibronectin type III domain-containing protein [Herbaspirillum sp. 1130]MBP1316311.1 hypothetical protein [Herbaspirillum sp. 1130]
MTILSAMIESAVLGLAKKPFVITGTKGAGYVLSVTPQSGYAVNGATAYQWTRDGVDIAGQTAATYTQLASDRGLAIDCRVTGLAYVVPGVKVPASSPSAPTSVVASPGDTSVMVTCGAPADIGGAAIESYQANAYKVSDGSLVGSVVGSSSPLTITGLANDVPVYVTVAAKNTAVAAYGAQSAPSNAVKPKPKQVLQVATRCSYPTTRSYTQIQSRVEMTAMDTLFTGLQVGFENSYSRLETANPSTATIRAAIEFPIGSGVLQHFQFSGAVRGVMASGGKILSDALNLTAPIPFGSKFWMWIYGDSGAGGQLCMTRGSSVNWTRDFTHDMTYGSTVNSSTTSIDYMDASPAARAALSDNVIWLGTGFGLKPTCLIAPTSRRNSVALLGDSRSAPESGDISKTPDLLVGPLERVFGIANAFINLSESNDRMEYFTSSSSWDKRKAYLQYCAGIANGLGTNDAPASDASSIITKEQAFLAHPSIAGKRIAGVTLPNRTSSTDQWTTIAGQSLAGGGAPAVAALNAWRKSASAYAKMVDLFAAVCDAGTGFFKVLPSARSITVSTTAGSSTVAVSGGAVSASDSDHMIYIPGAGASGGNLLMLASYVNANTLSLKGVPGGSAGTAGTAVTNVTAFMGCQEFTIDGLHESFGSGPAYAALAESSSFVEA